jgi:hypothetical protein
MPEAYGGQTMVEPRRGAPSRSGGGGFRGGELRP